jgi:DNA-binding XRE family transcriptional regulator
MPRRMDKRVIAKRKRLYTQHELAKVLGVHHKTVANLERSPVPSLLLEYLRAVGYVVAFYPVRKGQE